MNFMYHNELKVEKVKYRVTVLIAENPQHELGKILTKVPRTI